MKKLLLVFAVLSVLHFWHKHESTSPLISSAEAAEVEIYTASYCSECKRDK